MSISAQDYFDRANVCELNEKYEEAIANYTKAIGQQPHFPEAYFNRAGDRQLIGDYLNAIADYEMVIQQMPDEPLSHQYLSEIYLYADDDRFLNSALAYQHAIAACEITEYSNYKMLQTLAQACYANAHIRDAVKYIERAISIADNILQYDQQGQRTVESIDAEIMLPEMQQDRVKYLSEAAECNWLSRLIQYFRA